ncbi:RagB/SusD family nutrient uptake outer membrane protein [Formosa agariphila]|uniref:RagB/SusD family nutrient uptake outer membrane protein n=1 Tax=Formosa agariphila TaxID=320324 RepID=UPI00057162D1|nr:RagB/SusD family nutrient uptake outer membrane protein [Formosa agariphila]
MKKLIYILLLTLFFGVSSCSDELNITPSYELNEVNGITNEGKAEDAVHGIYPYIVQGNNYSGGLVYALASRSGLARFSTSDYNMTTTQTNNSPSQQYFWLGYYETINAANYAINGINKLGSDVISDDRKSELLAEARFLKAFACTYVFWKYGHWWESNDESPYGILYRDDLATVDNLQVGRLSVGDSYDRIMADIDFAIENLPDFKERGNRYVSKEFAKIFKAKILLYRYGFNDGRNKPELEEALAIVDEILNSNIPGFSMQSDLAQVYEDSWDSDENLFSGYLEQNGNADIWNASSYYFSTLITRGTLVWDWTTESQITAGLVNDAASWFKADGRWPIATGLMRYPYNATSNFKYYAWKKVCRLGQYWGLNAEPQDNKYNTYFFRYSELYIMKSELLARTGASVAEAIEPINTMRSLRTNPVLETLNPTSEQELMDLIFKEYSLETFLENGSAFFASLRMKNADGVLWMEGLKGFSIEFNKICYPIPDVEMLVNREIIQNPDLE